MRYYKGPKPCAACGISGIEKSRSSADSICHDCTDFIKLGKGVKLQTDKFVVVNVRGYSAKRFVYTPQDDNGNSDYKRNKTTENPPYLSDLNKKGSSEHLLQGMRHLLQSLNEGEKSKIVATMYMDDSGFGNALYLKENVAIGFMEFYTAFAEYARRLKQESFEEGTKLLVGLNNGTISLERFNETLKKQ